MRTFLMIGLSVFLLVAPSLSCADGSYVDKATNVVKENPGKSAGVTGCAALIIFPPAAIWCAATIVGGATYDGDTQKLIKKVTE